MALREPKEITIDDISGQSRRYHIGKIPYMSGGREMVVDYIASLQRGDYKRNQEIAVIMYRHVVAFGEDGTEIPLTTNALIDNHVPDVPTGVKIEKAIVEYNLGFSIAGKIRAFQQAWQRSFGQFNSAISTLLRDASRQPESAHGTNSEPSTAPKTHS